MLERPRLLAARSLPPLDPPPPKAPPRSPRSCVEALGEALGRDDAEGESPKPRSPPRFGFGCAEGLAAILPADGLAPPGRLAPGWVEARGAPPPARASEVAGRLYPPPLGEFERNDSRFAA